MLVLGGASRGRNLDPQFTGMRRIALDRGLGAGLGGVRVGSGTDTEGKFRCRGCCARRAADRDAVVGVHRERCRCAQSAGRRVEVGIERDVRVRGAETSLDRVQKVRSDPVGVNREGLTAHKSVGGLTDECGGCCRSGHRGNRGAEGVCRSRGGRQNRKCQSSRNKRTGGSDSCSAASEAIEAFEHDAPYEEWGFVLDRVGPVQRS